MSTIPASPRGFHTAPHCKTRPGFATELFSTLDRRAELAAEIAEAVIARLREDDRLNERDPFTQSNMDGLAETVLAVLEGDDGR